MKPLLIYIFVYALIQIQFAYPEEILHSISGHYDQYVRSLTFTTSVSRYGPYGVERDTNFSFPIVEGKIVGFHGRSGWYLDCIGVYLSNLYTPEVYLLSIYILLYK